MAFLDTWGKLVSIKDGNGNDVTTVKTSVGLIRIHTGIEDIGCGNNPVNMSDPSGEEAIPWGSLATGARTVATGAAKLLQRHLALLVL